MPDFNGKTDIELLDLWKRKQDLLQTLVGNLYTDILRQEILDIRLELHERMNAHRENYERLRNIL